MSPTGRLAPSPTGAQHLGNARTYLAAWLHARSRGGRVLLRVEDIDSPRVKPGAAEQALDDLRWLGLDWDGDPVTQSHRLAHYESALAVLRDMDLVYPCTCTRSDIAAAASAPHGEEPTYPGTCRNRSADDIPDGPHAWRFGVCDSPGFVDEYAGRIDIDLSRVGGDFVVWKSAGSPAYQLAVVVDDAAFGVTHVVRGDDLIPSTPRQLLLYRELELPPPTFAHLPLVVGPDGRRLAKRHGDTRLSTLREAGVSPEAVVGLLAWSCGWIDGIRPITPTELLSRFDLGAIPPSPFVLTAELLGRVGYVGRPGM